MTLPAGKEDLVEPLRFLETDISTLPAPGWYGAAVETACWRQSQQKNRMVYVSLVLEELSPPFARVADYFVLEGVTPRGIGCSRRRLVELFRACGLTPRAGEEIHPGELVGCELIVDVAHEVWQGRTRLRVIGYRPLAAGLARAPEEVFAESDQDLEGSGPSDE
jgi:hypothetical protein